MVRTRSPARARCPTGGATRRSRAAASSASPLAPLRLVCDALTLPPFALARRLVDLKNIYAKQLPNMPKDYIVRLVFDRGHKSLIAVKVRALSAPRAACCALTRRRRAA